MTKHHERMKRRVDAAGFSHHHHHQKQHSDPTQDYDRQERQPEDRV